MYWFLSSALNSLSNWLKNDDFCIKIVKISAFYLLEGLIYTAGDQFSEIMLIVWLGTCLLSATRFSRRPKTKGGTLGKRKFFC